ncbi:hypothetical protein EJ04DRAFT_517259 [Polyplosphaeria fusca]|uniref:Uncharacterized protein n=1 Tax=Polyplosphaeria fusca TaxID=682080 RepID=A0A9P4QL26_9PLEO|nr:hypothetical protein EJ04DRAFT_517259 [Polyplosphaeria fusca]
MPSSQLPPPIRTSTGGSTKSHASGPMSPHMHSPASTYSRATQSPTSPAEGSFFGAIASKIRGRSRSRSRAGRSRSKSPMMLPPEQLPHSPTPHPASPTYSTSSTSASRPRQPRHSSSASQSSVSSTTKPQRPSMQGPSRQSTSSSSSDMWRGRHSNSWLFNDFSVTDTAKDILHLNRKP